MYALRGFGSEKSRGEAESCKIRDLLRVVSHLRRSRRQGKPVGILQETPGGKAKADLEPNIARKLASWPGEPVIDLQIRPEKAFKPLLSKRFQGAPQHFAYVHTSGSLELAVGSAQAPLLHLPRIGEECCARIHRASWSLLTLQIALQIYEL